MGLDSTDLKNVILNHLATPRKSRVVPIAQPGWDPAHTQDVGREVSAAVGSPYTPDLVVMDEQTGAYHLFQSVHGQRDASALAAALAQAVGKGFRGARLYAYLTLAAQPDRPLTPEETSVVWQLATLPGIRWLLLAWPDRVRAFRPSQAVHLLGLTRGRREATETAGAETTTAPEPMWPPDTPEPAESSEGDREEEVDGEVQRPKTLGDLLRRPVFWLLILAFLLQLLRLL
ncbi:MAG: hypothetical protein HYY13_09330 [Nitrospirae bacterium]|nr:hypothetical protein [Nitrospirota bacterium]